MPGNRSSVSAARSWANPAISGILTTLVFLGQLHGHVDRADPAVTGEAAAREPRVGEGDRPNPRSFPGVTHPRGIHEVAHGEVVAVRRRVLEVRDGVDPRGVRGVPCAFGEPYRGGEGRFRRCVAVLGNDQEKDVVVLPVGGLEGFESEELGVDPG